MVQLNRIEQDYIATRPKSQKLYACAQKLIPSGVSHDARTLRPFPPYFERAQGAKKWDVDNNIYYDMGLGHGALILGHNHPEVMAAVNQQIDKGFHYSGCHELEINMAEQIIKLVPSAEKVRFQQSGTEANMLAVQIARAYTGRKKLIKFKGHFHGYWNEGTLAVKAPFDAPMSIGVPEELTSNVILVDHNDSENVKQIIGNTDDIACVIVDPAAHGFTFSNRPGFLQEIREITREKNVVLIFDEVVSGFRCAPGGLQELLAITPDLTTLAKTIGGGLPVSAVAGKKEILDMLTKTGDYNHDRFRRVISQGTHSGNAVALAAGLATLKVLSCGEPQRRLNNLGQVLRKKMNDTIKKHSIPGCARGNYSLTRIFLMHNCADFSTCNFVNCTYPDLERLDKGSPSQVARNLWLALLLYGVDLLGGSSLFLSTPLKEEDIERIVDAFDKSLLRLKQEKIMGI